MKPFEEVEVRVRCQHKVHYIRLQKSGRLTLCDHEESVATLIDAAKAARTIGSNLVRCGEVAAAWRVGDYRRLPDPLRQPCQQAFQRALDRQAIAYMPAPRTLHERLVGRTRAAAMYVLQHRAEYRRAQSSWVGGEHAIDVTVGPTVSAEGGSEKVWHAKHTWSGTNSHLRVCVRRDWLFQVFDRGLANIDGVFVLDVLDAEQPNAIEVVAVRQSRGFSVRAANAVIRTQPDGQRKLHWRRA